MTTLFCCHYHPIGFSRRGTERQSSQRTSNFRSLLSLMQTALKFGSSKFFVEGAALRATTNPGVTKDRRCRSGGDLPPPGLRLPPSRDALRRLSRLADGGASPPPIRAPSPRRDTNAAFAAHEFSRNHHPRRVPEKHVVAIMGHVDYGIILAMNQTMIYPDECYAIRGAIFEVCQQSVSYFS